MKNDTSLIKIHDHITKIYRLFYRKSAAPQMQMRYMGMNCDVCCELPSYFADIHFRSRYTVIALTRRIMNESESESECLRNKKAARNIRHNFDTIGYFLAIVFCPCNAFAFGGRLIFDKKVDISSLCDHGF